MAEGYIRKNDFTNAMAKINITRVAKGGLPPLAGITSATQPIAVGLAANSYACRAFLSRRASIRLAAETSWKR